MNNALAPLVNMYINQDPIRLILKNLLITMRKEVLELKKIGRMPTETLEDTEGILSLIEEYDSLISNIESPISLEEAKVIISIFPEGFFYDLHWDLVRLIESFLMQSEQQYLEIINQCPSEEWKEVLNIRYINWKKGFRVNLREFFKEYFIYYLSL